MLDRDEVNAVFDKFNKLLGLKVSDHFSSDLKLGLGVTNYESKVQAYDLCLKDSPSFSLIGQFNYENRGILCSVDARIVHYLTQACFGASVDDIAPKDNTCFSFSEQFIGKKLIHIISQFFKEKNLPVSLGRIDEQLKQMHLFFFDEQVVFVTMTCEIDSKSVGSISLLYPLKFIKQEKEALLLIDKQENEIKELAND